MSKITGILIDVLSEKVSTMTIEDELHAYYELMHTDLIDIQTRRIGTHKGRVYTIICDDEGLLKFEPKISAINGVGRVMFVGNLFVVKSDENYELISLNEDDIKYLNRFIHLQSTVRFPDPYPILHQVEYV